MIGKIFMLISITVNPAYDLNKKEENYQFLRIIWVWCLKIPLVAMWLIIDFFTNSNHHVPCLSLLKASLSTSSLY